MITEVSFTSKKAIEASPAYHQWAVISITEPTSAFGQANLQDGWHSVLRLEHYDVDPIRHPEDDIEAAMPEDQAKQIVEFVNLVAPLVDGIMVHCNQGVSRSAAIAKWIAEYYQLPFDQTYHQHNLHIYQLLKKSHPCLS